MTAGIEATSLQRSVSTGSFIGTFDVQKHATKLDTSFKEAYSQQRFGYQTQTTAPPIEGKPSFISEAAPGEANPVEDINARILDNITEIRAYLARLESHIQKA